MEWIHLAQNRDSCIH